MSNGQPIKIKFKTAHVEIEYEGSEEFLRAELLELTTKIEETYKASPPIDMLPQQAVVPSQQVTSNDAPKISLSLKSIAAKLNVTSEPELVLATCAYLTLSANRDTFTRKDIFDTMKTASGFYKKSYSSNLSVTLDGLIKNGKLLHQANDVFALSVQTRSELESRLGT